MSGDTGVRAYRRPAGWRPDAALWVALAALTALLATGWLPGPDLAARRLLNGPWPAAPYLLARGLNVLGSATLLAAVALALAVPLALRRRTPRPVLHVFASYLLTAALVVPVKLLTARPAPSSANPAAVDLFTEAGGLSYPSGHVANTLIWYPLLLALVAAAWRPPPRRVAVALLVGAPALVTITVGVLNFHWLTDVLGGLLIGAAVDRLLRRLPTYPVPVSGQGAAGAGQNAVTTEDRGAPTPS